MIRLPENIRDSDILKTHHLELLAGVTTLPEVDPSFDDDTLKNIFQYYSLMPDEMDAEIHRYAGELLDKGKVNEAWQVLLTSGFS